jgi:basic amino acid/polyamine antiporter, APA family
MMIVGGLCLFDVANFSPLVPYGREGVMRGATSSFFGYLGYDEVCCIAGEAKNPRHDLPRAVLWTLILVTILYVLASIALVGMLPSNEISDTSGFPDAFHSRGINWLAQLTAAGEVFTLPVVVLISLMAQPRLQLAVANDGLLPEIFARVDDKGNLTWGVLLAGIPMTLLATFVPFAFLDDLISVGILIAFCITNTSLILLKCEPHIGQPYLLHKSLCMYHVLAFATGLSSHWVSSRSNVARGVGFVAVMGLAGWIHMTFPPTGTFGGNVVRRHDSNAEFQHSLIGEGEFFQAPFVPLFPCIGIFINWYLISQLELSGMLLLILYIATITALYLGYCRKISFRGWRRPDYGSTGNADEFLDRDMVLLREFSMPKRSAQPNET